MYCFIIYIFIIFIIFIIYIIYTIIVLYLLYFKVINTILKILAYKFYHLFTIHNAKCHSLLSVFVTTVITLFISLLAKRLSRFPVSRDCETDKPLQKNRENFSALPEDDPVITPRPGRHRYQVGDVVRFNCTSAKSKPAAMLSWFINGEPVSDLRGTGLFMVTFKLVTAMKFRGKNESRFSSPVSYN